MIDSSILARHCAPEPPELTPAVRISELWKWTFEAIERSPSREALIDRWAREDYRDRAEWRSRYGLTSVVHELLTSGLQEAVFVVRVHDGSRAWRIPQTAFVGWSHDMDLEMTWTGGRLFDWDVSEPFRVIANLGLPLLVTEDEAGAFRSKVATHLAEVQGQSVGEPIQARNEDIRSWTSVWLPKRYWPVREALLWVASRDAEETAKLALNSIWDQAEDDGIAGAARARCEVEGQRQWRRIHEPEAEGRFIDALSAGNIRAHGLFEGMGPVREIEPVQWTRLVLDIPPKAQRDRGDAFASAARLQSQTHGLAWSCHWTGIAIDREDLFRAFPPVAVESPGAISLAPDQLMNRARWSTPETVVWVAFRHPERIAARLASDSLWIGLLIANTELRLAVLLAAIENAPDACDRFPRHALERAVQRGGLLAADMAPGGHATHRLEQLLRLEFWRDDVLAHFPELPVEDRAAVTDDSDEAVDVTIRRLSEERGSPLPRNEGAKTVKALHNSRSQKFIRSRIEALYPDATPGPRGPRNRAAKPAAPGTDSHFDRPKQA